MNLKQTLADLKANGTAQNRKIYSRHGVGTSMFGVSYAHLGKLKKRLKTNHELALELWKSGVHDARTLATMIADPEQLTPATLESWIKGCDNYVITDAVAGFAAKTKHAERKSAAWSKSSKEWIGAAGWTIVSSMEMNPEVPDGFLEKLLPAIEKGIHKAPNRKKHSMNQALISIGARSDALQKKATAAAARIGKIEVDHGATGRRILEGPSSFYLRQQRLRLAVY